MQRKGITLIGMPGAGKSKIGKFLARDLGFDFVDLDELIVQTSNLSPNDYLEKYGEDRLLDLEEKITLGLNLRKTIFSPGGSIVYRNKAMNKLKKEAVIVYIKVPKEKLKTRIKNMNTRAIIGLKEYGFDKLFDLRSPLYEKSADITLEITDEPEKATEEKLLKVLQNRF